MKTAAAYAESGEMRDVTSELWKAADSGRQEIINKVAMLIISLHCGIANIVSKRICW